MNAWLYRVYDLRGRPGPWLPHKGPEPSSRRPCAIIEFRPALKPAAISPETDQ